MHILRLDVAYANPLRFRDILCSSMYFAGAFDLFKALASISAHTTKTVPALPDIGCYIVETPFSQFKHLGHFVDKQSNNQCKTTLKSTFWVFGPNFQL